MHKSYLEFGYHVEDLLFKGITVNSVGGMVGLCLSVAIFTFSYEGVRTLRHRVTATIRNKNAKKHHQSNSNIDSRSERDMLVNDNKWHLNQWKKMRIHVIQAVLYMIQVTMSYLLMLIIMSYNAWLAITVFTSAGLSYYLFSTFMLHRPSVIPIEILSPEESRR